MAWSVAEARIEELRTRLAREPGSRLFAQLAEEHRKAGDLNEAIRVARTGLGSYPQYASARLTLGRALLDSGDVRGARGELEEALRQAPESIVARRFLGRALEAMGELAGALEHYRATLQRAPDDLELEAQVRDLSARLGAARQQPPGGVAATGPMPRLLSDLQGPPSVAEVAGGQEEGAAPAGGEPPFSSATLAELYLRQGLVERAAEVYRRVVVDQPENARARARLVEIERIAGATRGETDPAGHRRSGLERTIAGLEALLVAARRR